jgi:hypothetical protein
VPSNVFGGPFGGGATDSVIHPIVLLAMLLSALLILSLPRKYVAVPFLLTIFLVPRGQQLYVAGLHWYVMRIMFLIGCVRLMRAKFRMDGGLNGIDKAFIVYSVYGGICPLLLLPQMGMVIYQASTLLDSFCGYFFLRHALQDEDDIVRASKALAVITAVLGMFMLNEKLHHVNLFGYLGGTAIAPQVREGQIRAQAVFGHPILAGCFGATSMPLFFWLSKKKSAFFATLGVIGSTLMVLTSASSTPVLAYSAGTLSLLLWPIRSFMRVVRWGIVLILVGFEILMKAPVWFILAHVNVVGGSGGYDRAYLIDVFIRHFKDWWLIGTNDFGNWGLYMWDLSNQFVAIGDTGGLVAFACFIATISLSFGRLGSVRKQVGRQHQWLCWSLGAVLLSHIFAYFGVAYWDQSRVWWWACLAMISAATVTLQNVPARVETTETGGDVALASIPDGWAWHPALHYPEAWTMGPRRR